MTYLNDKMKEFIRTWSSGMRSIIQLVFYICVFVATLFVAGAMATAINKSQYGMTIISLLVMLFLFIIIPYKIGKKTKDGNKNRTSG